MSGCIIRNPRQYGHCTVSSHTSSDSRCPISDQTSQDSLQATLGRSHLSVMLGPGATLYQAMITMEQQACIPKPARTSTSSSPQACFRTPGVPAPPPGAPSKCHDPIVSKTSQTLRWLPGSTRPTRGQQRRPIRGGVIAPGGDGCLKANYRGKSEALRRG